MHSTSRLQFLALLAAVLCAVPPPAQAQSLARNPAAAGLWVGEVSLNEVTHAAGGTNAPTADTAQLRLILHVGALGEVRLLRDVIIAKRIPVSSANVVLVTDPALLSTLPGLVRQNGKLLAQRIASAAFDYDGNEALFDGGIGQNFRCEGLLKLSADHPTNPFLHKYHSDHSEGFEIHRTVALRFLQASSQFNGIERLTGEYQETVTGLYKAPLTTRGTVVLNRITSSAQLNQ